MSNKTLIIDLHNLSHRAAHAYNLWSGPIFTGLYHGVFKMLLTYINELNPTKLVIVSDPINAGKKKCWRHDVLPTYKNRAPKRNDESEKRYTAIQIQLEELKMALQYLPIYWFEQDYIEADDLIAYITKFLWPNEEKIVISTDKDMFQLVDHTTTVFYPGAKNKAWITLGEFSRITAGFVDTNKKLALESRWYPSSTDEWLDYRALVGDTSDNISGLKGVGPKKAWDIMTQGGFDAVYSGLVRKHKKTKLETYIASDEGHRDYHLSRHLMKLPPNCEIGIDLSSELHCSTQLQEQAFLQWCDQYSLKEIKQIIAPARALQSNMSMENNASYQNTR